MIYIISWSPLLAQSKAEQFPFCNAGSKCNSHARPPLAHLIYDTDIQQTRFLFEIAMVLTQTQTLTICNMPSSSTAATTNIRRRQTDILRTARPQPTQTTARTMLSPIPTPPLVSVSFISCSSPGKKISWPDPFRTQKDATQPIDARLPTIHHAIPMIPRSCHVPYQYPARMGPIVRKVAEHACPIP